MGVEWHEIRPGWSLIALDTTIATNPYSSGGYFSERLEHSLQKALEEIPQHHAIILLNHFPFFQNEQRRNLERGPALSQILQKEPRIRLYLHGHTHRQIIADLQVSKFPIVLDSGSCTDREQGSWNLIDLHAETCTVTAYRWQDHWHPTTSKDFTWTRPGLQTV